MEKHAEDVWWGARSESCEGNCRNEESNGDFGTIGVLTGSERYAILLAAFQLR